ncbi:hypothetical protein, partial [Pseudomonas syringae group genomosp. 7]|uniref:hypothetical protein n=1 Tax=Pseudomonas syringae group genomosp. 7 TaxID=251699 RepID=UPI0037704203
WFVCVRFVCGVVLDSVGGGCGFFFWVGLGVVAGAGLVSCVVLAVGFVGCAVLGVLVALAIARLWGRLYVGHCCEGGYD